VGTGEARLPVPRFFIALFIIISAEDVVTVVFACDITPPEKEKKNVFISVI
jgi:hypothetical protein